MTDPQPTPTPPAHCPVCGKPPQTTWGPTALIPQATIRFDCGAAWTSGADTWWTKSCPDAMTAALRWGAALNEINTPPARDKNEFMPAVRELARIYGIAQRALNTKLQP